MHHMECAEIWGGIGNRNEEVCSSGVLACIYSNACDGNEGGDIYYLSVCAEDKITRIAIADVAGHGSQVTDTSKMLYEVLDAHMNDMDCDNVLVDLNEKALAHGIEAMTTATVIGFYTEDSNLYFSYAGHQPMLIRPKDSAQWLPVELESNHSGIANIPLGVVPKPDFDQQSLSLHSGDQIFLYTDGLTEAKNAKGELFGEENLVRILTEAANTDISGIQEAVLAQLQQHTGGDMDHDDVTFLTLQIR